MPSAEIDRAKALPGVIVDGTLSNIHGCSAGAAHGLDVIPASLPIPRPELPAIVSNGRRHRLNRSISILDDVLQDPNYDVAKRLSVLIGDPPFDHAQRRQLDDVARDRGREDDLVR